jgi:hypothetical protein
MRIFSLDSDAVLLWFEDLRALNLKVLSFAV